MKIWRWSLAALGCLAMLYALTGALAHRDLWSNWLRLLAFVLIGHELIAMPLAIAVGFLIGRTTTGRVKAVLQAATFASAVVCVVAFPAMVGAGIDPNLPSALPRDYGRGLLIILAAIWCAAAAAILARRSKPTTPREELS